MRRLFFALLLLALPALGDAAIKSGASSDKWTINTNKAGLVAGGISTRATHIASSSALVTTALYSIQVNAGASLGYKLVKWCVGTTNATAAAGVTVTIQRRTTAASGGTAMTVEGTGADAIAKMDPADSNFSGVGTRTGTLGTAGAVVDQQGFMVGEFGAGTADPPGLPPFCKSYGDLGDKMPTVAAGTANGISISVSSLGAGGLAFGSISATIIEE